MMESSDDERAERPDAGPPGDPLWPVGAVGSSATTPQPPLELEDAPDRWALMRAPGRGRLLAAAGVVAAVLLGAVVFVVVSREDDGPELIPVIPVDGWAPYWALDDSVGEISHRDGSMREVSPFWFSASGVDEITVEPNASTDRAEDFLDHADEALIVPSIVDGLGAGEMAAILANPGTRRRHVDAIVEFAADGDYDGVDLNYEQFAFADGRDSWETTRPNWVSFITALAKELHADGRTLTVSVPVVYDGGRNDDSGYWVYDYAAIVEHVDRIRMMAYDYSVADPGPIAPLSFVQRAIAGAIDATGQPDKLVLGLPAYGRNWPVSVTGKCPEPDPDNDISVPSVTTVTTRSVDDLIERRNAVPAYDSETGEWFFEYRLEISDDTTTCVQTRQVHYVDADGIRTRMDLAIDAGLGGVSLWALGFEDDDVWDQILIDATLPDDSDATDQ
jgi:spore germination protein YaaH